MAHVEVSEATSGDDEDRDTGLPLFWGFLLVVAVVIAAVFLFGDFGAASAETTAGDQRAETEVAEAEAVTGDATVGGLMDVLRSDVRFGTLVGLLERTGLDSDLGGPGPFTLFAPPNDVLSRVDLGDDDAEIRQTLLDHVVPSLLTSVDLPGAGMLVTAGGNDIVVVDGADLFVGGASVTEVDIAASNGVIHAVSDVVAVAAPVGDGSTSSKLAADGRFETLQAALQATGLAAVIDGDVTVLAPTDDAFGALPEGVLGDLAADPDRMAALLGFHVIEGDVDGPGSYVTSAGELIEVGESDIEGVSIVDQDGRLIVLDGVLVPDGFVLADVNDILDLAPITFESASAAITADGQAELDRAVAYLAANPVRVEVGGHTDSDGEETANQELSLERAEAVVDYLVAEGVDAGLLTAVGYGETQPVASNDTEEGQSQNRRIEFSILG